MTAANYQPRDTKDALRHLQTLVNQYYRAPLTADLLAYNQKQITYLQENVIPYAQQVEHNLQRQQEAQLMMQELQRWQVLRLQGHNVAGKMRHFRFQAATVTKYHTPKPKRQSLPHYHTSPRH
ncbi:hypothetical protein H3R26_06370 [Lactobacillus sp. W8092]|nr:hypothetical protein [Lactobacillus sp. W8092]